ncbi:ABC transporter permease [Paludisphaera mucosa]|uniref:ABC transporter permease subunit n=1 Tax=Paludisphaera mucosa TaxID=3030827 RepID=A0ABT6F5B3_9BACT|nr:ABC transporter permease subunit [Paludisphaera mucosa]MDG3002766.1 ABC transporter permease subunit [Paludisphaera mucosa]
MAMQDALGPVFAYEWIRTSRRWQLYALRAAFVATILGGLVVVWMSQRWNLDALDLRRIAEFGQTVYNAIVTVELALILLAAPAATAGAVCLDKARGTLLHVMATDLTDAEIVLGKLGAALIPVVGLVFCVLPVLMLTTLLGGVDPVTLLGSVAVSLGTAVLGCTLAFTLSVWGRKTHEVLSATYLFLIFWVTVTPFLATGLRIAGFSPSGWFDSFLHFFAWTNPFNLIAPSYNEPASTHLLSVSVFLVICLAISALMTIATIRRIRSLTLNQRAEAAPSKSRRGRPGLRLPTVLPTPSLDANPVLWREWTRMRPSRWAAWTWLAYSAFALVLTWLALVDVMNGGRVGELAVFANMYLVGIGLLLLSVRAATSLSEERVRGSLDVLLATPMSTPSILAGKWWGTFRLVPCLAVLPGLIGAVACLQSGKWGCLVGMIGLIVAYGAAVTSVGLAISVWVVRQGRVLALSVGLYVAACVGWVVVAVLSEHGSSKFVPLIVMGSPLYGPVFAMFGVLGETAPGPAEMITMVPIGIVVWNVAYWILAIVLFHMACETFDRCLGRVPGWGAYDPAEDGLGALFPRFRRESRDKAPAIPPATEPA